MPSENPPPNILYHYTTQHGLLGILKEKALWVTNLHYLNDPTEFIYSIALAKKRFQDKIESLEKIRDDMKVGLLTPDRPEYQSLIALKAHMRSLDFQSHIPVYICSFSQMGDQLGQWRGYCHNESGFSIGFDYRRLQGLAKEQNFILEPCTYDPQMQDTKIEELVNELLETDILSEDPEKDAKYRKAIHSFWYSVPTIKHNSFREEVEWRLISKAIGTSQIKPLFRPGKSMIIPYVHFSLTDDLPIREIIVGPNPHGDLSVSSIMTLKLVNELKSAIIKLSDVPYRNW